MLAHNRFLLQKAAEVTLASDVEDAVVKLHAAEALLVVLGPPRS